MSPVLSTLAIANFAHPCGLVMYADDGVLMARDSIDFNYFDRINRVGAEIAVEKSGIVGGPFKFLGLTIDLAKREITDGNSIFCFSEWCSETAIGLVL